nr:hypothetical protein [Chryseolinea soli]
MRMDIKYHLPLGHTHLSKCGLINGEFHSLFNMRFDLIIWDGFRPTYFLQGQLTAGVIEFFDARETVAGISHHEAGFAYVF